MAALAAALSLGTGWAWFSQERAFWLQLLASGLSMLIALLLGQDDTIALLWAVFAELMVLHHARAAAGNNVGRRAPYRSIQPYLLGQPHTGDTSAARSQLWTLASKPPLTGRRLAATEHRPHLQMAEGKAAANRELLATRNRLQQEWLLTLNIAPKTNNRHQRIRRLRRAL